MSGSVINMFTGDELVTVPKLLESLSTRDDIKGVMVIAELTDDTYDVFHSRMKYSDVVVMSRVGSEFGSNVVRKMFDEE